MVGRVPLTELGTFVHAQMDLVERTARLLHVHQRLVKTVEAVPSTGLVMCVHVPMATPELTVKQHLATLSHVKMAA
jgi:hypothetical protein